MKIYEDKHGYATIEKDICSNFPKYIKKASQEVGTIIIVGAYHGYEIDKLLALCPNANVTAFEPFPRNFAILQKRYQNNPKVKCINSACSNFNGTSEFHELSAEGNGSLLKVSEKSIYKLKEVETVKVEVVTLDSIIQDIPVDLLWMDVQGNELNVLKGYSNQDKVLSMFLEIAIEGFGHESYEGNCHLGDLQDHLKNHTLHSLGLDNELKNGTGNSFWLRNDFNE